MTASTVERSPRPLSRPYARACLRFAVRGFVVAGLAGAAWLLSSSSAHASDGESSSGPVTGLVSVLSGGPTGTDDRPEPTAGGLVTGILPVATKVPALVAGEHAGSAEADGDLTRTVRGLVSPVLQPVTRTVAPVLDTLPPNVASKRPARAATPKMSATTRVQQVDRRVGPDPATFTTGADGAAHRRSSVGAVRPAIASAPVEAGRAGPTTPQGANHVPALPRPAPFPASPAPGSSGVPSLGSGLHQDGGVSAVVTAAYATGEVAALRPESAAEVRAPRLRCESPTVSPD